MASSITASLPQTNLGAHKDNPIRENLWVPAVPLSLILLNLLGSQDNLMFNKANLGPSRVTPLDSRDSLIFNKANPVFSKVTPLDHLDNLTFSKDNLESSTGTLLGRVVNPLLILSSHLDKLVNPMVNQPSS